MNKVKVFLHSCLNFQIRTLLSFYVLTILFTCTFYALFNYQSNKNDIYYRSYFGVRPNLELRDDLVVPGKIYFKNWFGTRNEIIYQLYLEHLNILRKNTSLKIQVKFNKEVAIFSENLSKHELQELYANTWNQLLKNIFITAQDFFMLNSEEVSLLYVDQLKISNLEKNLLLKKRHTLEKNELILFSKNNLKSIEKTKNSLHAYLPVPYVIAEKSIAPYEKKASLILIFVASLISGIGTAAFFYFICRYRSIHKVEPDKAQTNLQEINKMNYSNLKYFHALFNRFNFYKSFISYQLCFVCLCIGYVWFMHLWYSSGYYSFSLVFLLSFLIFYPKNAFSPQSIFFAYYGAWFIVSPIFATRYVDKLNLREYSLASFFAATVFCLGIITLGIGEKLGFLSKRINFPNRIHLINLNLINIVKFLFILSSLMILLIIASSGGFKIWINAPGDAFLNRSGSGVFVILSHFFSIFLAAIVGYISYQYQKHSYLIIFLLWVLLTSAVHGSKMQISLLVLISLLPYIRKLKLISLKSIALYFSLLFVFFLGLFFRNISWITLEKILPYSLNYFSTLENLAISVRDFQPSILTTFFLPFQKFKTPFGLSSPNLYYDMNHLLTDIYLPTAWKIRATEQWPVETDLYLNFMFFGGLPLVVLYLGFVGFCYGLAQRLNNLGNWLVSLLMTIFMISHLRGSLYNHIDFYMYPYILVVWILLFNLKFSDKLDV